MLTNRKNTSILALAYINNLAWKLSFNANSLVFSINPSFVAGTDISVLTFYGFIYMSSFRIVDKQVNHDCIICNDLWQMIATGNKYASDYWEKQYE